MTLGDKLTQWLALHSLGRKPTTAHFNTEIMGIIRQQLPGLERDATSLTTDELLAFAQSVAHYCPSHWNAIVSVLRFVTERARRLNSQRQKGAITPRSERIARVISGRCPSRPRLCS